MGLAGSILCVCVFYANGPWAMIRHFFLHNGKKRGISRDKTII